MILIPCSSCPKLGVAIAEQLNIPCLMATTKFFGDTELHVQVESSLRGKSILLVQSLSRPVNDHLIELLLVAHAAKKAGALHLTAVVPYLGYGRQNQNPPSVELIVRLIETSDIQKVVTLDLHSKLIEKFFTIPITHLEVYFELSLRALSESKEACDGSLKSEVAHDTFAAFIKELSLDPSSVIMISPDRGGEQRVKQIANLLGFDWLSVEKVRNSLEGASISSHFPEDHKERVAGKVCVIIDDMVDTGHTLKNAFYLLAAYGAKRISVLITHCVGLERHLSPVLKDLLQHAIFDRLFISNSIENDLNESAVDLVDVSIMLADAIRR